MYSAGKARKKHDSHQGRRTKAGPHGGQQLDIARSEQPEQMRDEKKKQAAAQAVKGVGQAGQPGKRGVDGHEDQHGPKGDQVGNALGNDVHDRASDHGEGGDNESNEHFRGKGHSASEVFFGVAALPGLVQRWSRCHSRSGRARCRPGTLDARGQNGQI